MDQLQIARDFTFPLDAVTKTFAILAKKGAGKSYTAGVMQEEFAKNQVPFIVIDCMSAHWGIKEKYPVYIFGGPQKDIPISPEMGRDVARTIVENNISAILDISLFSKSSQRKFVADFCDEIYTINKTARHIFLEETPEFAPQVVRSEDARVFNAIDRIVRLGRSKGIGITLISQRSQKVNKDVLSQLDTLIAMRLTFQPDIEVIANLMKKNVNTESIKRFESEVQLLGDGEAFIWSPEYLKCFVRVKIRKKETYHAGKTPELGEIEKVQLVKVDSAKLAEAFSKLIEEKSQEKSEVKLLRDQLQAKDKQLDRMNNQIADLNNKLDILNLVSEKMGIKPTDVKKEIPKDFEELIRKKDLEITGLKHDIKAKIAEKEQLESKLFKFETLKNLFAQLFGGNVKVSAAAPVNKEEIVAEVLKRVPKSTGGGVVYVAQIEKIKKDFLNEAKNKILTDIKSVSDNARKTLKFLEAQGKGVTTKDIATKCYMYPQSGGGYGKIVLDSVKELMSIQVADKDAKAAFTFGRLRERITFLFEVHEASAEEIQQVYDHVLAEC